MALFALVHGSMHGGWCWRDLIPALERRGHRAVAPDLPCDDVEAGLVAYADAVEASIEALAASDTGASLDPRAPLATRRTQRAAGGPAASPIRSEPLVLVGHSLGSRTIPVVASRRPGAHMIFLCSVPTGTGPVEAAAFAGMVTEAYAAAPAETRADGARRMQADAARSVFFGTSPEPTAHWAASRLRWQGPRPLAEPTPFAQWPEGPIDVVLTRDDATVRFEWARAEARRWLEGREPIVLPGDHSPFFTCPERLADVLVGCLGPDASDRSTGGGR